MQKAVKLSAVVNIRGTPREYRIRCPVHSRNMETGFVFVTKFQQTRIGSDCLYVSVVCVLKCDRPL